jgi:pimeloyl-ACP methyl ester carboxylesterase
MSNIGFQKYHSDITLNFMLNRMSADVDPSELRNFANGIEGLDAWIEAALAAGESEEAAGNNQAAGCYFRGAEFFMAPDHPRKSEAYERFMAAFAASNPEAEALRKSVNFQGGELGVIDIPASGTEKDTIVACSGFDGLIEEMYAALLPLSANGYRVVLYEGTGQGAALRRSHLPMQFDWEKSVSAILDALDINSCTLLGLSLGGYLAPRAAAFEHRAKRLIAWGPMYEFLDCFRPRIGDEAFAALKALLDDDNAEIVNQLLGARMKEDATTRWSLTHGMHTCGGQTPFDFLKWAQDLNLETVSDQISQDTLIIAGSKDHLVPPEQLWRQASALTNAHSVTTRLFTEFENAAEHCQVSNTSVVVGEIHRWLGALRERDGI